MKNDPYFKYLAAFIFAGVILAFVNPAPAAAAVTVKNTALATNSAAARLHHGGHHDRS